MPRGIHYLSRKPDLVNIIENEAITVSQITLVLERYQYSAFELNRCTADDMTPLLAAIVRGDTTLCTVLINHGARIDSLNFEGHNLLHSAVALCLDKGMLTFLIDSGVSPYYIAADGDSAVSYAQKHTRTALLEVITARGEFIDKEDIIDCAVPISLSLYPIDEGSESLEVSEEVISIAGDAA